MAATSSMGEPSAETVVGSLETHSQVSDFSVPRRPPDASFVTLSDALTWIAFRHSVAAAQLATELGIGKPRSPSERIADAEKDEMLAQAVNLFTDLASGGAIEARGKFYHSTLADDRDILILPISQESLSNYRQFDAPGDLLYRGGGLGWGSNRQDFPPLSDDHYREVVIRRSDLMNHFPNGGLNRKPDRQRGRKLGTGSLARADEALFPKIKNLIDKQIEFSVNAAALRIADKAAGAGTTESKAQRLAKRYRRSPLHGEH